MGASVYTFYTLLVVEERKAKYMVWLESDEEDSSSEDESSSDE